jgi:hypothetical protein
MSMMSQYGSTHWIVDTMGFFYPFPAEGVEWSDADIEASLTTDTIVRSISVTAPDAGYVVVNAALYANGTSSGRDMMRCSITTGTSLDYSHLMIGDDHGDTTTAWSYFMLAGTRGFSQSAGTTTYNLVCNTYSGTIAYGDPSLTAVFQYKRY